MTVLRHLIKRGRYYDSVVLMQLQRQLAESEGVDEAGVMMATPANQELLVASGLLAGPVAGARADDLLVTVCARTAIVAEQALARFDELASSRQAIGSEVYRPKSLRMGLAQLPAAQWVLISVPGRHAAEVARRALAADRNVFLYSDNVSLADEVRLKEIAAARGLLVLGPDCGTAIVGGVGLGFANRVRRGPIGLVGASGTGLQSVTARIHDLGSGISQALGTGGRDLSLEVGGATASRALALLAADPETEVLVVLSKPPEQAVADRLLAAARSCGKPVVVQFQGYPVPARRIANLHFAVDLEDAARLAFELATGKTELPPTAKRSAAIRGLFSGGTLAGEALLRLELLLPDLTSNLSGHRAQKLAAAQSAASHCVLDLGADELTVGRPHPMIDPQLVVEHLAKNAADPAVGTIVLDVVLGDGAHPDPASLLAPAVAAATGRDGEELAVIAVLVGTDDDPQDLAAQRETLETAGATVHRSLGPAIDAALARTAVADSKPAAAGGDRGARALDAPLVAVNVGLELFHDSLVAQGAQVVQVDWRPPAGGNEKLAAILARLEPAP